MQTVPDPTPAPHGVVIRVSATGLCRSDWHGWVGHDPDICLPHVPGHEFAGTIQAVGNRVTKWKVVDRVTVPFVCACGSCEQCAAGDQQVCPHQTQPGFTHWGSFAQYVAIDFADVNLVSLPDEIDDATAASLGCRFATAFRGLVDQARLGAGQTVAIYGCGGVGLSAIMIARALGATIIAVDIDAEKLNFARSIGADFTWNALDKSDVAAEIIEQTQGGVHVSVDALGSTQTCKASIESLRKRGRHIQIGLMPAEQGKCELPMGKIIADELEIYGSHGMQAHRYPAMLELIRSQKVDPAKLISKTIPLSQAPNALAQMNQFPGTGVTIIDPHQ